MPRRLFSSSLVRSSGVYTAANVLNSAIPFFLLPILTRYLTPGDYGIVAMFQVLLGIAGTFTGLGVNAAIGRQYFERDSIDFSQYVTNCLYIVAASSLLVGVTVWEFSGLISHYTQFPSRWLWTVVAVSVGQSITLIMLVLWQVQIKPWAYGKFQILLTSTNVGLSLLFIIGLGMGWQGRVRGQVSAYVIFAFVGLFFLWKGGWLKRGYNSSYVRHALGYGIPLIPHTLGVLVIMMTDRVLITNMIGIAAAGVYVVGVQMGMVILLLQDSFNRAWVPWLFEQLKKNDRAVNVRIIKITYAYNVLIIVTAILFAWVAPRFLSIFVGKDFIGAGDYVFWIALGYAFNGMYKMVTNYIFYEGKTHILAWVTFLTAALNVPLSYGMIKINGAVGAAQGTMIAFFISFVLTWILASRVHRMPWRLG